MHSRLSEFVKGVRGKKSTRDFAEEIDNLFTYTYLYYIEEEKRSPKQEKWLEFAEKFGLDLEEAIRMLNEHRIMVKIKKNKFHTFKTKKD